MPDQQRRHLEGSWSSLAQAVSETLIVAEEEDFAVINDEWQKWFPSDPPARQGQSPVRVPGLKVSIAMMAEA